MSKKVTKPQKEAPRYEFGDPVLGKVRGYPPWPGVVVDPSDVPPPVLAEQPLSKKSSFYCVLFFPMGDYAWLNPKDLSALKQHEIEAFLADDIKKRNGDLREGYRIALNPQPWMIARAEAAHAAHEAAADAQVDELESENEMNEDGTSLRKEKKEKSASKKRKRELEAGEAGSKPKKMPAKLKKSGSDEPTKKKSTSGNKGSKRNGAKSKAMIESEDDADVVEPEDEDDDDEIITNRKKRASPPPTKKQKRDKDDDGDNVKLTDPNALRVREWRHSLQKTFLGHKAPTTQNMAEWDQLFAKVEKYNLMTIEQLQFSKIGKVMRHIAALSDDRKPPRDKEFQFRARAKVLVERWQAILSANKESRANAAANGGGPSSSGGAPLSIAGINGTGSSKEEVGDVTNGTRDLDLNSKGDAADADGEQDQDAHAEADGDADGQGDGDGDVSMAEVAVGEV